MNKIIDVTQSEKLLSYLIDNANLDLDSVLADMNKTERKKLLEPYKDKIWQGKGKDKRFKVRLQDRKIIAKATREELENTLVEILSKDEKRTLKTLYPEWFTYKKSISKEESTMYQIHLYWERYYLKDDIINKPLEKLDFLTLKSWVYELIKKYEMTKKAYYNISIIIRQMFIYALEKGYIESNEFAKVKVDYNIFRRPKKKDETQVYLVDEQEKIEAEAWKDFNDTKSTTALAILLAFQTGMRSGELLALQFSDISDDGKYISVAKQEQRTRVQRPDGTWDCSGTKIGAPKSVAGERTVYLTQSAQEIIKLVKETNQTQGLYDRDYIFCNKEGKIHSRALESRLEKYCNHISIKTKSPHKIRKTYVSTLIDNNVNLNLVRELVGHSKISTTLNCYCYNRYNSEQTENILENALSGKSA